jgi:hypothetical protein
VSIALGTRDHAGAVLWSQFRDEPQNLLEHLPWDDDLGYLEGDVAAVAQDLRADLPGQCVCAVAWLLSPN